MKTNRLSSWFNSAKELYESGHPLESRKLLLDIYKASPKFIPSIELLSIIDYKLQNFSKAKKWTDSLLRISPENPDLINRQVMIQMAMGDIEGATLVLERGLKQHNDHPGLIYNAIRLNTQRDDQSSVKELLERIPRDHPLHSKSEKYLKEFYHKRGILNQALAEVYKRNDWPRAMQIYQEWLKENEHSADSYYNMGLLFMKSGNHVEAILSFQKCLKYKPHFHIAVYLYMWYNKLMICDWSDYEEVNAILEEGISEYLQTSKPDYDIPIYVLSFLELDEQIFSKCGTMAYQRIVNKINIPELRVNNIDKTDEKIRIGYLSSSLRTHPIGRVYQDIFALHDRSKFEVFVYSTGHQEDPVSKRIREGTDKFRDLTDSESQKAYSIISDDKLDILITVGGHGDDMNMELIAMKPAPIIVNAHGYNESFGGDFIDYLISDEEVLDTNNRPYFSENILFLSGCSIPPAPFEKPIIRNREYYGLPEDKFIFLSAAHPRKITPDIFQIWKEILLANPDSILWVLDFGIDEVKENLLKAINSDLEKRIFFSGIVPYSEHLGRYHLADLLLDTPIYNCHSVGMEALRNGLPFITIKGKNANSRFGTSMLRAAGLGELVCNSADEYLGKAISYSINHSELKKCRDVLRHSNPFFDIQRYVTQLENCFKTILERHNTESEIHTDFHIY